METEDVVTTRRKRLRQAIDERFDGKLVNLIDKTGINSGELTMLLKNKSFGEKKARKLELQAGLPVGYLDGEARDVFGYSEHQAAIAEFIAVYTNTSAEGRSFLDGAISAAKLAFTHVSIKSDFRVARKSEQ